MISTLFLHQLRIHITFSLIEDDKSNFKAMEEKLSKVFEEKLSDRRDYLEMIAQIRGKSDNLYEKMVQAGETRVDALYVDKENPNSKHQKEQKSPDHQNNKKDVQKCLTLNSTLFFYSLRLFT